MATNVDYIFRLTPYEVIELLSKETGTMSVHDFKMGAMSYALDHGRTPSNFSRSWRKWERGEQNMPMKVEQYLRDVYDFEDGGTEDHKEINRKLEDSLDKAFEIYRREVIEAYIKEHNCKCASKDS